MFGRGVGWYSHGIAKVDIYFPEGEICCQWCRFCRPDDMGRYWCRLSNEMIYNPKNGRGQDCPIEEFVKEDRHGKHAAV